MRLTPNQTQQLIDKLNSHWHSPRICSICGKDQWTVSDTIFEMREFVEGALYVGKDVRIYPVIPVTCTSCGNTVFLNAITYGIVPPASEKDQGGRQ